MIEREFERRMDPESRAECFDGSNRTNILNSEGEVVSEVYELSRDDKNILILVIPSFFCIFGCKNTYVARLKSANACLVVMSVLEAAGIISKGSTVSKRLSCVQPSLGCSVLREIFLKLQKENFAPAVGLR